MKVRQYFFKFIGNKYCGGTNITTSWTMGRRKNAIDISKIWRRSKIPTSRAQACGVVGQPRQPTMGIRGVPYWGKNPTGLTRTLSWSSFLMEHEEDDIEPKVIATSTLIRCSYLILGTLWSVWREREGEYSRFSIKLAYF